MKNQASLAEGSNDGRSSLHRTLSPSGIAVIGASSDPTKRGYQAIRALKDDHYGGDIYGVNPRGGETCGVRFVASISALPHGVDVALVALPGRLVPDTLRQLSERGVAGAVVLANGFGEADTEAGRSLNAELHRAIAETGVRVIGPNTSGILNIQEGVNLVGLPNVKAGPVSVITQSGNMLLSLVEDSSQQQGPGFASYVGLGNQADIGYHECIDYFAENATTGAIVLHCEGLTEGRAFLQSASNAFSKKPIVMLRGGRSEVGQRAAMSHTGSIAGPDDTAVAVLEQAGVELVDRSDELAVVAGVMATTTSIAQGTAVAILADGGGHATLAADSLVARGVKLATFHEETEDRLRSVLGEAASIRNPVDVAGATDSDPTLFADAVNVLLSDRNVGMVLIVGLYGAYHLRFDPKLEPAEDATAQRLIAIQRTREKPVLVQSCYAGRNVANHTRLRGAGIQVLSSIDHATRAVEALSRRGNRLATQIERTDFRVPFDSETAGDGSQLKTGLLSEPIARGLIEKSGINLGPWSFAESANELTEAIRSFDRPCAVKVVSEQVVHKSDIGGVVLNVAAEDGSRAWDQIVADVDAAVPGAVIDGMIAAPMAEPGVELLVGATRDPIFGPIVAFGSGGVLVEALKDVSFRAAPLTAIEATELIDETLASRLLEGYRGLPPVNREELASFLVTVGDFIASEPRITEIDFNPVIARDEAIQPVDVRIVCRAHPDERNKTA